MENTELNDFGDKTTDKQIKSTFDALDIGSNTHSESTTVTRDIIISRTEQPLETWGRNQVLYTQDMVDLLDGHKLKAIEQEGKTKADYVNKTIEELPKELQEILLMQKTLQLRYLGEMQLLYAHTRSRSGITHDALIKSPTANLEQEILTLKEQLTTQKTNTEGMKHEQTE